MENSAPGEKPVTTPSQDGREREFSWPDDDEPKFPTRVRDLFVWQSPSHSQRQYPKEFFTTLGAICLLLSIILAFFQEWFAILVVWAAFFLFYATTKAVPQDVEHKITTQGIVSLGRSYLWSEFGPFWFSDKHGETFLHVAYRNIFGQIMFLVGPEDKEIIRDILAHYIPFIEAYEKSPIEKLADWLAKKFPVQHPVKEPPKSTSPVESKPEPAPSATTMPVNGPPVEQPTPSIVEPKPVSDTKPQPPSLDDILKDLAREKPPVEPQPSPGV